MSVFAKTISLPVSHDTLMKLESLANEKNISPLRNSDCSEWTVEDMAYVALVLAVEERFENIVRNRSLDKEVFEMLNAKEST